MVWNKPPNIECPECGQQKPEYGHRRNVKNLCNACFNLQERRDAMMKVGRGLIKCAHCSCIEPRSIVIHHLDDDGKLDYSMSADGRVKTPGNNQRFYRMINNGDRGLYDLILLCRNCHNIRHVERREKQKRQGHNFTSKDMTTLKRKEKKLVTSMTLDLVIPKS